MLFSEDKIDSRLLKLKLVLLADNLLEDEGKISTRTDFVEKREIDRSTLYSFDGPFQLIHMDVGNLELLCSSATTPRYVLLIADLYSSKICVSNAIKEANCTKNGFILQWS